MTGIAHSLPASLTLSVGAYEVYVLRDGIYRAPIEDMIHAQGEAARQAAIAKWAKPQFAVDVNCFALSGAGGLVLIDAGAGDEEGPDYGNALLALRDAGFQPGDVSHVLLTHIHFDHLGGLFDGSTPRYPNATVYVPRGDLAFYVEDPSGEAPARKRSGIANVKRLREVYGDRVQPLGFGPVLPGIDARALPGHTPGHTGFVIHDDRRSLLILSDALHLVPLQLEDPEVGLRYDIDPAAAIHSRQSALETAAREGWYVAGSHVSGIHRVERRDRGYGFLRENGERG